VVLNKKFFRGLYYMALNNIFSQKNINLFVGLITLLVVLWLVMFTVPSIFYYFFDTGLGNLFLILFIILAGVYDMTLAIGLALVFIVLYRFSHMKLEHFII